jgi:tetratricopeptide (TPR) repeat protein
MKPERRHINRVVAALAAVAWFSMPAAAEGDKVEDLFRQLAGAETADAGHRVAAAIREEWSKSGSSAIDLLLHRGEVALEAGDPVGAAEHFTAAIDHDPAFAEAWHGRATAYYLSGQIGPAISDLRQALALNPLHFGAMEGFAIILEELDRPEQAFEVWKRVAEIYPTNQAATEAIGRLELALKGQTL